MAARRTIFDSPENVLTPADISAVVAALSPPASRTQQRAHAARQAALPAAYRLAGTWTTSSSDIVRHSTDDSESMALQQCSSSRSSAASSEVVQAPHPADLDLLRMASPNYLAQAAARRQRSARGHSVRRKRRAMPTFGERAGVSTGAAASASSQLSADQASLDARAGQEASNWVVGCRARLARWCGINAGRAVQAATAQRRHLGGMALWCARDTTGARCDVPIPADAACQLAWWVLACPLTLSEQSAMDQLCAGVPSTPALWLRQAIAHCMLQDLGPAQEYDLRGLRNALCSAMQTGDCAPLYGAVAATLRQAAPGSSLPRDVQWLHALALAEMREERRAQESGNLLPVKLTGLLGAEHEPIFRMASAGPDGPRATPVHLAVAWNDLVQQYLQHVAEFGQAAGQTPSMDVVHAMPKIIAQVLAVPGKPSSIAAVRVTRSAWLRAAVSAVHRGPRSPASASGGAAVQLPGPPVIPPPRNAEDVHDAAQAHILAVLVAGLRPLTPAQAWRPISVSAATALPAEALGDALSRVAQLRTCLQQRRARAETAYVQAAVELRAAHLAVRRHARSMAK